MFIITYNDALLMTSNRSKERDVSTISAVVADVWQPRTEFVPGTSPLKNIYKKVLVQF